MVHVARERPEKQALEHNGNERQSVRTSPSGARWGQHPRASLGYDGAAGTVLATMNRGTGHPVNFATPLFTKDRVRHRKNWS